MRHISIDLHRKARFTCHKKTTRIQVEYRHAVPPASMTARVTTRPPPPPNGLGRVTKQPVEKPSSSGCTSSPVQTSILCDAPTNRLQSNISKSHDQLRQDGKRSSPSMAIHDVIFRPRPYEEIYAEQAYLTTSLQVQSKKAADLTRRYCAVEIEVATMEASKERRRQRKLLNLLRSRINEVAEQEKAIFLRLSELYMETHSRDTLDQMRHQRARNSTVASPSGSTAGSESPTCTKSRPSTPLNGATPEFMPRSQAGEIRASIQIVRKSLPSAPASSPPSALKIAGPVLETVDESSEEFACNHGLSYQYKVAEKMDEEERPQKRTPRSDDLPKYRENRLSLPSLESLWPI